MERIIKNSALALVAIIAMSPLTSQATKKRKKPIDATELHSFARLNALVEAAANMQAANTADQEQKEQEQAQALWAAQQQAAIAYQAAYQAAYQEALQQEIARQAACGHEPEKLKRTKYEKTKTQERKEIRIAAAEKYRASQELSALTEAEKENINMRQPGLCPYGCLHVFKNLDSVVCHLERVHSDSRPYPCTAICQDGLPCAYAGKKRNDLNKHLDIGDHSSSKKGRGPSKKYRPYIKACQLAAADR